MRQLAFQYSHCPPLATWRADCHANEYTTNAKSWYGRDRLVHNGLVAHRAEDRCHAATKKLTAGLAARTSTTMIRDEKCGLASGRAKTPRSPLYLTPWIDGDTERIWLIKWQIGESANGLFQPGDHRAAFQQLRSNAPAATTALRAASIVYWSRRLGIIRFSGRAKFRCRFIRPRGRDKFRRVDLNGCDGFC
jgi:hypothetical protein